MSDTHQKITVFITKDAPEDPHGKPRFCVLLREKLKVGDISFGMLVTEKELDEAPDEYLAQKFVQGLRRMHEEIKKKEAQK